MEYNITEIEGKIHVFDVFSAKEENFKKSLDGIDSISTPSYKVSIKEFPMVPREIKPKLLFNLGVYFNDTSINTQRNFWSYLMLQCDVETYKKFLSLHSEEIRERISPTC